MQQSSHDEYGKMNFHNLDGKYANCPDSVHGEGIKDVNSNEVRPTSFWNVIHGFYGDGCSAARETQKNSGYVTIEFVNDRKATVNYFDHDVLVGRKIIRGKFHDGYFYRRKYFLPIPIIPLWFGYNTYRYRFATKDNKLVVDYGWNGWFFSLLAGAYSRGACQLWYFKE